MSTPTHFAATLRARGRLPAVTIHGPIRDGLLMPLARAGSEASGWDGGHRGFSASQLLPSIKDALSRGCHLNRTGVFTAEPLTEAEHAARFPDEPETPMRGGWPVALLPDPQPATS